MCGLRSLSSSLSPETVLKQDYTKDLGLPPKTLPQAFPAEIRVYVVTSACSGTINGQSIRWKFLWFLFLVSFC